ncbi:PREDICTED: LOW QUALITY PROTEIN: kinesin-like protein KIF18A [Vollenhovia emeryi]|uniref:LOW QUALITY PROTEIN: kinesin-like protein KIF18A n=1 Tax=Vollenhovia emeryi TaxID=411798 RepID=UPI0005F514FD|nr:PREDICTED: LOW QUALITY PROTEIN: kinesin-like protein KIF18A [Vollenhovia emeryi]
MAVTVNLCQNRLKENRVKIQVIVRVRPPNERELQDNCRTVIEVVDDKMLIFDPKEHETPFFFRNVPQKGRDMLKRQNKQLPFIFDQVFDLASSNADVFEGSTKSVISSLLDGYNCSVFAYGATGAGKTHTMLGSREDLGITYRTMAQLFAEIENHQSQHRKFNLGVSYLEIYNENVQNLLHKTDPLHLREDGRGGVVVAGLEPIAIQNAEELLSLLAEGNKNRTQHPTDANKESSRSHAIFQVYIMMTNKLDGQVQRVKLSMIDLVGSERASATGCKGARFKEGANINKSLLALGNCINNLADGIKHIPYRDSKLTRLLKDSLGGNCRTVMIANIAPSSFAYEDTYNTLRYANRAKKIKSIPKKNVSCETHVAGYIKIVDEQKKEIDVLKSRLAAFENGALQPAECKPSLAMLETYRLVELNNSMPAIGTAIPGMDDEDALNSILNAGESSCAKNLSRKRVFDKNSEGGSTSSKQTKKLVHKENEGLYK